MFKTSCSLFLFNLSQFHHSVRLKIITVNYQNPKVISAIRLRMGSHLQMELTMQFSFQICIVFLEVYAVIPQSGVAWSSMSYLFKCINLWFHKKHKLYERVSKYDKHPFIVSENDIIYSVKNASSYMAYEILILFTAMVFLWYSEYLINDREHTHTYMRENNIKIYFRGIEYEDMNNNKMQ